MGILRFYIVLIFSSVSFEIFAQQYMYVSSRNTNSVKRYNAQTGEYIDDFVKPGDNGLGSTQEVVFGPDGNLYVCGRNNTAIQKYNPTTGEFLGNFTSGYALDNPTKITFGPDGYLYISQWGQQKLKVARFDANTGEFIDEFTNINLNQGCGHAWDNSGNLYVASFGSKDVKKFDSEGVFINVFTEAGKLQGPVNLWFGEDGDLFVVDWTLGSVLKFDGETGAFKENFITGLQNAEGITFGPDSNIYICDWSRNQVRRYDTEGNFMDVFASTGNMQAPNSVVFGPPSITNVSESDILINDFELHQNYPNPFNPTTKIAFTIPGNADLKSAKHVLLKIYDLLGKEIATIINEYHSPGLCEVSFDAGNLASGIYLYTLKSGNYIQTQKMLLLK